MTGPVIRQVYEEDLPACGRVYAAAFARAPYHEAWEPDDATDLLRSLFVAHPDLGFCLVHDGEIVGIAFCSTVGRFRAVIEEFAIHPSYQGNGWGRILLDYCLSVFRYAGYPRVELIANGEAPAHAFYRRMGFRQSRRYVLMMKDL